MSKVNENIKAFRTVANMTQQELADKLLVTRQTISGWENGRTEPDLESLVRLSEVLQISVEELLSGEQTSKKPLQKNWKKQLVIAFIWTAVMIVWFIVCRKYVFWYQGAYLQGDVVGMFLWYYLLKPMKYVLIAITALSYLRVVYDIRISITWVRVLLLVISGVFIVLFLGSVIGAWFGEGTSGMWRQIFLFFNQTSAYKLECIYMIPTLCIYFGVIPPRKANQDA